MAAQNQRSFSLLIDGQWIATESTFTVSNPFTEQPLAQVSLGGEKEIENAIKAAQKAFKITREQTPFQRAEFLLSVAKGIENRKADFIDTMVAESGKPITLAEAEVTRAVITFTVAAEEARREQGELLSADAFAPGKNHFGLTRRFPLGVIYGITPFNFPLNLVAHKVAPCLATGNTMILKPSPKTPLSSFLLGEILTASGMTPGQINIVTLPNELAGRLVADDRIQLVSFTGSAAVGWDIKARSGKKRVVLELGGNAGVIVHRDADLSAAIPAIAMGGFSNAGQSCISVQRILVHESIYDDFKSKFVAHIREKIKVGDPTKRKTVLGAMIDRAALDRITGWIQKAIDDGAKLVCGGKKVGDRQNLLEPTVLESVTSTMQICVEEAFAPVVTLHSYHDFNDALALVNDSQYGLQAGIFTQEINLAWQAFSQLDVGGVLINQVPTFRLENMPYGGVKNSGFGREGIRYAMEEMTELKSLIFNFSNV